MISPISSISGYNVQAIYGNPVSTRAVQPISEDTSAHKAMMTVSKNDDLELQKSVAEDSQFDDEQRPQITGLLAGNDAEIVKQLEELNKIVNEVDSSMNENNEENPAHDLDMIYQNMMNENNKQYYNSFLEMGYQQNIRDKVLNTSPQAQLANITQNAQLEREAQLSDMNRNPEELYEITSKNEIYYDKIMKQDNAARFANMFM